MNISILISGIVSCIMLTIFLFIYSHAYNAKWATDKGPVADLDSPVESPLWLFSLMVIMLLIPIVGVGVFLFTSTMWLCDYRDGNIRLGNLPKWADKLLTLLNTPIKL